MIDMIANDSSDGSSDISILSVLYQYAKSFNSDIEIDHNAYTTTFWIRRKGDGNMWFDLSGTTVLVSYWSERNAYDMNNPADFKAIMELIKDTLTGDFHSVKICDVTFS